MRLACLVLLLAFGSIADGAETKRVLVLFDERTELPGLAALDESLTRTLATSPVPLEIYREEMDLSRLGSPTYLLRLREHLRAKYAGRKMDVAIAAMGPSLEFLLRHGDSVFPGAPVVFLGLDERELRGRALPAHVTGVMVRRVFPPTLELALQLHPQTKRVIFVAGASEFDNRLLSEARSQLRGYEDRLAFEYLTGLPMGELLQRISQLPPQSIVLYSTVFRDGAGQVFVPHEAAERVAAAANAPVYAFIDQYLGRGIVGGRMYSLNEHGEEAARLALQVLAGAAPSSLAPVATGPGQTLLDWRQMQRWDIAESRLPADAVVRYRPTSIWSQYRGYAIGTVSIVALQGLLISGLLVQRSRRRRAEAALLESEEVHRLTLGNISDAVFITTSDGDFTFICPNVHIIFGYSHAEVEELGNIRRLLGDGVFDPASLDAAGEIPNIERRTRDKARHEHDLLITVKRIAIRRGRVLYTCRDVSDRRRAEEANRNLAHAHRLAGMGELTAMIAHEVNQPLGAILSNAEAAEMLLQAEDPPLHEIREILADIRSNDLRADESIRRIRSLLRKREMKPERLDLNDAVADVLKLATGDALSREVRLRGELSPALPPVFGDRVHLQQVLLNLIINAMDAMKDTPQADRELTVRTQRAEDGGIEVAVADRGTGIPAARVSAIFDSFVTTKPDGMGLGLSISRSIVIAHGGRIWAKNNSGGGATFRFSLPAAK
jgi:PAS domain S-box-containing protein